MTIKCLECQRLITQKDIYKSGFEAGKKHGYSQFHKQLKTDLLARMDENHIIPISDFLWQELKRIVAEQSE